jgi:DNA polymerase-1
VSKDPTLLACFKKGEDFYSVIGAPIYDKTECSLFKDEANSFATLYEDLRNNSKIIALATPYGRTAFQQAATMGISRDEAQMLINRYFEQYPHVEAMMLESHEIVKKNGVVYNLFGRPRRIPEAKNITKIYGNASHSELPYTARTLLNLSMNHRVQSTAASIVNRAAIMLWDLIQARALEDSRYEEAKIVLQVHDEVIVECPQELAEEIRALLKHSMEKAVTLPGVDLIADPKIANNIAGLK